MLKTSCLCITTGNFMHDEPMLNTSMALGVLHKRQLSIEEQTYNEVLYHLNLAELKVTIKGHLLRPNEGSSSKLEVIKPLFFRLL